MDGLLQNRLLLQETLQLQILLGALGLGHLVPVGVVDSLEEALLEAGELAELLVQPLDLLLEVDVCSQLEEDASHAEVRDSTAFGNILLVADDDDLRAFSKSCEKISLLSYYLLVSNNEGVCTDLRW